MAITIGFDNGKPFIKTDFDSYHNVILTDLEKEALNIVEQIITADGLDYSLIRLERHSSNYLSLICGEHNDFCRIKAGPVSKWISLDLWLCPAEVIENEKLSFITKRNMRHWKIPLTSLDRLYYYGEIITGAYRYALEQKS